MPSVITVPEELYPLMSRMLQILEREVARDLASRTTGLAETIASLQSDVAELERANARLLEENDNLCDEIARLNQATP